MDKLPGIFNDIIGPVMRGPSSSHTAASWRIARTAMNILNEQLSDALIEFDRDGAWAPNYREQGTCMGIEGGLLQLDITDERIKNSGSYARDKGIKIEYQVASFPTSHANTVRITLCGRSGKKVQIVAVSLGGGSFEIRSIDGVEVKIQGDLYEIIFYTKRKTAISGELESVLSSEVDIIYMELDSRCRVECKSPSSFSEDEITQLQKHEEIDDIAIIYPIMPVISGKQSELPFSTIPSLVEYAIKEGKDLGELGLLYEKHQSGLSEAELTQQMNSIIQIIHNSIDTGLEGTHYKDRILQQQSHLIGIAEKEGKINDSIVNRVISNVSALMEAKSGMEVIVAVPTAGSCGTVGGSLRAVAEDIESNERELIKAYFAAGLVGAYFAQGPGFSAEEHGCQVECGAASGMAAAGIVQIMGGTAKQAIDAASMAIQNMIGLVCDPVADRVEVPCLGKNLCAAMNAYSSAIMAISGFDALIPLDQVIQTVSEVSKTMPACVKCTGKGGLALTETSQEIKKSLTERNVN